MKKYLIKFLHYLLLLNYSVSIIIIEIHIHLPSPQERSVLNDAIFSMNSLMHGGFISAEPSPPCSAAGAIQTTSPLFRSQRTSHSPWFHLSVAQEITSAVVLLPPHLFLLKSPAAFIIKLFAEPQTAGIILEYTLKGVPCRCWSTLYWKTPLFNPSSVTLYSCAPLPD